LNGHGLVFDELINGEAVMHYSRPSNNVNNLCDYAHVSVNQWPIGSFFLPTGQLVKN